VIERILRPLARLGDRLLCVVRCVLRVRKRFAEGPIAVQLTGFENFAAVQTFDELGVIVPRD
jgi:hypothetical protein